MFAGRKRMALATALLAVFLAAAIVMMDGAWGSSRGSERRHLAALLNDMCRFRPPQSEKKKTFSIFFFSRFAIESCSARFLFAFSTLPFRFFRKSKISVPPEVSWRS